MKSIIRILLAICLLAECFARPLHVQASESGKKDEKQVTVSLTGDCSLGKLSTHGYEGTFYEMYDKYGPGYFFQGVKEYFEADDMTLINFEGVLTDSEKLMPKEFNIKGKPEYRQILTEGNIEAVSFGNNHRIDYGEQGVVDTVAAFEDVGVVYAYDEITGVYTTKDGVRIGIVSVNEVYDEEKVEAYLMKGLRRLRMEEKAEIVIACCHWGEEKEHYIEDYQSELGHKCINWGADIVVGNHPHVLQGIEKYKGKYILYSLGNFCFGANKNPPNKDSMIVLAQFQVRDGRAVGTTLKVLPCTISSTEKRNDYCPTVANGKRAASIIQKLNQYSESFGITIDADGVVSQAE